MYVGETSRAAYTRVNERMDNYRAAFITDLPAMVQSENRVIFGNYCVYKPIYLNIVLSSEHVRSMKVLWTNE